MLLAIHPKSQENNIPVWENSSNQTTLRMIKAIPVRPLS
jgi:hypothetical protein